MFSDSQIASSMVLGGLMFAFTLLTITLPKIVADDCRNDRLTVNRNLFIATELTRAVLLAPVSEELIFRFAPYVVAASSREKALIIGLGCNIFFALCHTGIKNTVSRFTHVAFAFVAGLLLLGAVVTTKNIFLAVGLHAAINLVMWRDYITGGEVKVLTSRKGQAEVIETTLQGWDFLQIVRRRPAKGVSL
ncbi:Abortive infection protein [candidate division TM7 genomosp. GTL1]|nr:Abortive infection protein [candidate division TM7 genomosp. GTL1]